MDETKPKHLQPATHKEWLENLQHKQKAHDCSVIECDRGISSKWRLEAGRGGGGACESVAGSLAGGLVALVDVGPVDDVEESLDVVGAQVLVLEVVGVFPHVQAKQRHQACGVQRSESLGDLGPRRRRTKRTACKHLRLPCVRMVHPV